jgi:DNA-binding LacI/PurR family transcriptional regulator
LLEEQLIPYHRDIAFLWHEHGKKRDILTAKRVTSQDVAERAGVSRTTVSLVLNNVEGVQISDETRKRVLEIARELDYVPEAAAQALARRRVQIVGLILTRSPHHIASDTFLTQILDGLIDVVHKHDMRLLIDILEPDSQKNSYLRMVRSKRIDGIILSGPRFNDEALEVLEKEGFPTVLMGHLPGTACTTIDVDNFSASRSAVGHLIGLGHSRVACITNSPLTFTAASERLKGYQQALEEAGISFDASLVRYGDFDPDSGYVQMQDLLKNFSKDTPPFSAVFVASDVVAYGAKAALREHGLSVPKDIALVGFDDVPFSRYTDPPLTTVRLPAYDLGWKSGDLLIRMIKGEKISKTRVLLETELVVRESCGAGNAQKNG